MVAGLQRYTGLDPRFVNYLVIDKAGRALQKIGVAARHGDRRTELAHQRRDFALAVDGQDAYARPVVFHQTLERLPLTIDSGN